MPKREEEARKTTKKYVHMAKQRELGFVQITSQEKLYFLVKRKPDVCSPLVKAWNEVESMCNILIQVTRQHTVGLVQGLGKVGHLIK